MTGAFILSIVIAICPAWAVASFLKHVTPGSLSFFGLVGLTLVAAAMGGCMVFYLFPWFSWFYVDVDKVLENRQSAVQEHLNGKAARDLEQRLRAAVQAEGGANTESLTDYGGAAAGKTQDEGKLPRRL